MPKESLIGIRPNEGMFQWWIVLQGLGSALEGRRGWDSKAAVEKHGEMSQVLWFLVAAILGLGAGGVLAFGNGRLVEEEISSCSVDRLN